MNYDNFNENIKSVICKNIKKYRNEKGVRLMDLAEAVGVSSDHLKRIEAVNDRDNISLITLYKISVVLGVRIDRFFEEWKQMDKDEKQVHLFLLLKNTIY